MEKAGEQPHHDHFKVKILVLLSNVVQKRIVLLQDIVFNIRNQSLTPQQGILLVFCVIKIFVENCSDQHRENRECAVEERGVKVIVNSLGTEIAVRGKQNLGQCENKIFIKKIKNHLRIADVVLSPVIQH